VNEAFGPVGMEMVDQRFLFVERFIGHQFSYELVRESILKIDSGCNGFGHKAKGKPVN